MSLNPYLLFGLDPQTITLKQLKKKYYELALLVHPDKNHVQDGNDMHVVHMAYKYCAQEIEHTTEKQTSVECLEKQFEDFCKIQTDVPPSFRDIMEDALEMKKFNKAFEESDGFKASFQGGYQELMEPSDYAINDELIDTNNTNNTNIPLADVNYCCNEETPLKNDFSSLIVYTDTISTTTTNDYYDYKREEPVESYTLLMKKTCLTDYKEANTKQNADLDAFSESNTRTYEDLLSEREVLNITLQKPEV